MANFQPDIPQGIEHILDHTLGMRRGLIRAQEQEIDIGAWRENAASIPPRREHSHTLSVGGIARAKHMGRDEIIKRVQHFIHHR